MGVHIFWDSRVPSGFAHPVTAGLSSVLNIPVSRIDNGTFPLEGFDPGRNQYDALKILLKLDLFRSVHKDLFRSASSAGTGSLIGEKVLLITAGDLFTERSSFVFGLAYPKLGVAVVSVTRMDNRFYHLHPDDSLMMKRIITESSHEIAHLYGLEHCDNPSCIMLCPYSYDDLDRKDTFFCGKCRMILDSKIQGGV